MSVELPRDAEGQAIPLNTKALDEGTDEMRLIDPKGSVRKAHYIPSINGFGANAWVRIGPFKKIENVAAGENAIDNLVKRLEADGWKVVSK